MASFLSAKFERYGLIDTDPSPAERVYVADPHSDTEASLRQPVENDEDPDGATIFSGFQSEATLASADLDGVVQAEAWMTGHKDIEMVGVTPDHLIQWYNASRLSATEELDLTQTSLAQSQVSMVQDGGVQGQHGVYATRNGLLSLAPQNGGWADTDNDGTPDGCREDGLKSTAFSSGVYEAFVDTNAGSRGSLNATIPFPVGGVDLTLSAEFTQLHDDGKTAILVSTQDASGSPISSSSVTAASTGRKSVTITTDPGTYFVHVEPFAIINVTSETSKVKIKDPCLRVNGGTSYVAK